MAHADTCPRKGIYKRATVKCTCGDTARKQRASRLAYEAKLLARQHTEEEMLDCVEERPGRAVAALRDIEGELREQASGSQDGYLLDVANRMRAALKQLDD